jgi:cytochrome c-type biogenesis protein CcmH
MKEMRGWILMFCLLVLCLLPEAPAFAQQPTPSDDQVNAIAHQLYCPVCQDTPLDVCPTQACQQWRELIRQMLAEGKSEAQIKQYFVENYGARVLAEPPPTGFNVLIYILPPLAFLAGVALLLRAYRRGAGGRRPAEVPAGSSTKAPEESYVERLEAELNKRR